MLSHSRMVRSVRRSARAAVIRTGREEQGRALLGRLREAHANFDPATRRGLRDEHAMRVLMAAVLRHDSNAIDVGANEGQTLAMILAAAPNGRHIAYEPIPDLARRLRVAHPHVDVREAACSDEVGTAEFTHIVNPPAFSGFRQRQDLPTRTPEIERLTVRLEKLDDSLPDGYTPSLVKIDVEGAELLVMLGAEQTIGRYRPYVLFEHGSSAADLYGSKPGEVYDLLEGAGLRIFDLDGDGPYTREHFEAVFVEPIWNFLAAPS